MALLNLPPRRATAMGGAALEEMVWACVNRQGRGRLKKLEAEPATKGAVGAVGQ